MKGFSVLLIAVGLLVLAGSSAGNPGGNVAAAGNARGNALSEDLPPANQGVCDEVLDATPGLHGLCVSFCEAQQCVPDLSQDDPFQDCPPSAQRLLDNYNQIKGPDDPDMPCVQEEEPCPCWSSDELASLRHPDATDQTLCTISPSTARWIIQGEDDAGSYDTWVVGNASEQRCFLRDICADGNCLNESRNLGVSEEEALACRMQAELSARFRLSCD